MLECLANRAMQLMTIKLAYNVAHRLQTAKHTFGEIARKIPMHVARIYRQITMNMGFFHIFERCGAGNH